MREKAQNEISDIVNEILDIPEDNITHYSYDKAYEQPFDSSVVTSIETNSEDSDLKRLVSILIDRKYDVNRTGTSLNVMINHSVSQRFNPSGNIE